MQSLKVRRFQIYIAWCHFSQIDSKISKKFTCLYRWKTEMPMTNQKQLTCANISVFEYSRQIELKMVHCPKEINYQGWAEQFENLSWVSQSCAAQNNYFRLGSKELYYLNFVTCTQNTIITIQQFIIIIYIDISIKVHQFVCSKQA